MHIVRWSSAQFENTFFYVFLKIQKNATFYVFLKCHVKKRKKTQKALSKFSLFSTLKLLTNTFTVKQLHTMLYIQNCIKTIHFLLKYNGLAIVRKTTKLIEGGHRDLQDYRHICYYFYVFFTFFTFFFKIQKVVTCNVFLPCFVRFLELWSSG